jgi:hypothetical protein
MQHNGPFSELPRHATREVPQLVSNRILAGEHLPIAIVSRMVPNLASELHEGRAQRIKSDCS